MKKILLAIDASHMDTDVIHFACNIARLTHSTLTGVFLSNYTEDAFVVNMAFGMPYVENVVADDLSANAVLQKKQSEHIQQFEKTCEVKGVRCQVQSSNSKFPARSIIEESRFADLVIVQPTISFEGKPDSALTGVVKEILADAECPVIVAPLNIANIEQIVFAYDGSRSAVFAIKQFAYLFPELSDKKAIVLQVNKEEAMPVTEKEKLGRLLRLHYSSIGFQVLKGKPSEALFGYLLNKENTIVVMGAFGRGWLSGLLKPATADLLLQTINLPFFITHH